MFKPSFSLCIDKISFTCNDANQQAVIRTCDRLGAIANSGISQFQLRSGKRHFCQGSFGLNARNQLLVQAGARHSGISDYRFEFNPSSLVSSGIDEIREFIEGNWETPIDHLFGNGRVTRIDLALDIEGVSLEEAVVRSSKSRKHSVYTNANGDIETVYLGSGKKNRTVVYSKEKEGKYLRIERRLRPLCNGRDLVHLPNPFQKVQIIATSSLLPHVQGMVPQQFFDSIRLRGLTHAIRDFPASFQKSIRLAFADPANSLMPPMDVLWDAWPRELEGSGLGSFLRPTPAQQAAE
ncbi:hypothetical protein JQ561_03810 [Bradyrhizobium diazoefficiens]|nr:hypothetical protein [Bradyrhizobium diazoefficiens]MBR0925721.1 hypothetical protein [Bradyrhizobium diazoefficiens]